MENKGTSGGMGLLSVLGIIFIVLKLCHVIEWSWIWVLAPFWICFAIWIPMLARGFMITVNMTTNTIKVRGHANYAPHGQDIVCAGVTALTQTLVESLETLTGNEIKYDMSPGRVDIEIMNPDEDAQLLTDSFLVGIEMIVDEFPEHIREWVGAKV